MPIIQTKELTKPRMVSGDSPWLSPWLIIGSVGLLAAILAVIAFRHLDREKHFMEMCISFLGTASLIAKLKFPMVGKVTYGGETERSLVRGNFILNSSLAYFC